MFIVEANYEVDDEGGWGLEWAVVGEGRSGDDEQVEQDTERGKTDEDPSNDCIDGEEVIGEGIAEKEKSGLEHEREDFHDQAKMPCDHAIDLELSMAATIDRGSTYLHLGIIAEPLLG